MMDAFIAQYKHPEMSTRQFEKDLKKLTRGIKFNKLQRWTVNVLIWTFCISWMIQAGIALNQNFFWFPVDIGTKSMLGFINIFWVILWFAIPFTIIIYSIIILIEYDNEN